MHNGVRASVLRKAVDIRFDYDLHGLLAGMNFDTDRPVAEVHLMLSAVFPSNDCVSHASCHP